MNKLSRLVIACLAAIPLLPATIQAQDNVVVVVREFSVGPKTGWPYDVKQLQSQTVAELRGKAGSRLEVDSESPVTPSSHVYTLNARSFPGVLVMQRSESWWEWDQVVSLPKFAIG